MFPAFDSGEDAVGICGPDEGFWFGIGFQDEAVDGGLEIVDGSEDAANEAPSGELGEESLDRIEPRCGGRSEVEGPAGVSGKPFTHFGMFMGSVVIDDGMDRLSLRHPRFDGVEEADELLMAVSFHVLPDDGAIEDIEGSKQRRGTVALVVMRHRAGAARFHRQARLGAVERLDLALFVDREDHRMSGRVDVEADNVLEFLCEFGIVRQLERSDAMGAS